MNAMTHNKLVYTKRIIAFVDILGFSTFISDSISDTTVRRKLLKATELIHKIKERHDEKCQISTFSDSAVISYPLDLHGSLFNILVDVIHLQLWLGQIGIMIRGGITIGDLYHDGDILFGPAMNEAYRLESKVATYPRVIIESDILKKAYKSSCEKNPYGDESEWRDIMSCVKGDDYTEEKNDADIFFVDFLHQDKELYEFGDEYLEWLRDFRVAIVEGLNRYSRSSKEYQIMHSDEQRLADKIFKKYRWIREYWNSVVTDENAFFPVPDIDDQKGFREQYKKLKIRYRYPY